MRSLLLLGLCLGLSTTSLADPWLRHPLDASSRGADGVRLGDINGDGRLDVVTGWEQGGVIRVCLNPGPEQARQPWPAVTVGQVRSPEDAVFADLDNDGTLDVVSCCEGSERTIFVHWAPQERAQALTAAAWQTAPIPATQKQQMWMFALPMQVDGRGGIDLIVGSKGNGATVSWLQAPAEPRDLNSWKLHPLYRAGWVMSLAAHDVDGDGDDDVIVSDRKGPNRGVLWLENPGADANAHRETPAWREHRLGGTGKETMFLDVADLDRDGRTDIVCATQHGRLVYLRRSGDSADAWEERWIENPNGVPGGKSVRVADIDGDGRLDLVHTAELGGNRQWPGVVWMSYPHSPLDAIWNVHDISGSAGVKFDLVELLDLDDDGDLDVLACEETDNLGVFWYENPSSK